MPNHVANKINFYGDQEGIRKVLELIKGEETCIDFNKIIPMPKTLHLTAGGDQNQARQYALSKKTDVERIKVQVALTRARCDFYSSYFNLSRLFQFLVTRISQSYNPSLAVTKLVWAPSISLAATLEIDVSFFSSSYLDVSVQRVGLLTDVRSST